jgi:hypothetical protein
MKLIENDTIILASPHPFSLNRLRSKVGSVRVTYQLCAISLNVARTKSLHRGQNMQGGDDEFKTPCSDAEWDARVLVAG